MYHTSQIPEEMQIIVLGFSTPGWISTSFVLALAVRIVTSDVDVMLEERVLVAVDHCGHIFEDRLNLRLLALVEPWRAQIFQRGCAVPVDV